MASLESVASPDCHGMTVVGRSADGESEDAVDLWHEIRRVAE